MPPEHKPKPLEPGRWPHPKPSGPAGHKPPEPGHPPHPKPSKEGTGKNRVKAIVLSVALGTVVALIAGLALNFFQIQINVILPVLAPIWIGVTSLAFMELRQH